MPRLTLEHPPTESYPSRAMQRSTIPSVLLNAQEPEHSIQSVTIFQSSTAEIIRSFRTNLRVSPRPRFLNINLMHCLKSGINKVDIVNLSSSIDKESPRIHYGGTEARLFALSCDVPRNTSGSLSKSQNVHTITKIRTQKKALYAERGLREQENDAFSSNARILLQKADSNKLESVLDRMMERQRAGKQAIQDLDEQIAKLDQEISELSKNTGQAGATVSATIVAEQDCDIAFQLTYRERPLDQSLRYSAD